MRTKSLRGERRSAVAVLFAILAIPMLGLIGLAIDYGFWNQANSAIALAASDAALNAVKTAGSADIAHDPNYLSEGQIAGQTWFTTNIGAGSNAAHLSNLAATVTMSQTNNIITASVTYSGDVKSIFGAGLFAIGQYPLNLQASASINTAPYTEIQILLDNSNSMQIGATASDMARLMQLSPCDESLYYPNPNTELNPGGEPPATYGGYAYAIGNWAYSLTTTPVPEPNWQYPANKYVPLPQRDGGSELYSNDGPTCQGAVNQETGAVQPLANGNYPQAGPPCAFACHWDNTAPAGAGDDLYSMARSTNGTGNPIVLRFDVVKQAVNTVISTMQADNTSNNNLTVGISDFNSTLNRDYPTSGEAGGDFTAAAAAVGGPPTVPHGPDTGIQPETLVGQALHSDTDFANAAVQLYNQLTPSGNGNTPDAPNKVLFLVTDGLQDIGGGRSAFDTSKCDMFKSPPFNYTIYVVYMQYYPLAWYGYVGDGISNLVERTGPGTVSYALQQCASTPADYIEANDNKTLTAALQTFLKAALTSAATFTN